ncbi:hypothetical protein B0O99DRAFT_103320 [Bisporella sp. PMI_857]|nr:hypothetical protein B0O99DRAFT_103320 [Bisporella sp. PMI_857]
MLPSSGQGTAFAIEDATLLANCLLNKPPTNDKPNLHNEFSHYAQLRVPRSKLMAKTAYWIGVAGLGQTWCWRWLRDFSSKWTAAGVDLKLNNKDIKQWPFDARLKVEIYEKAI